MWMEEILKIKKEDLQRVKEMLLKDEQVSRASIVFKEASGLGFEGEDYYCYLSGPDELIKKAKELVKELSEEVGEKDKKEIIKKIKEEEEKAMTGFGSIFG